MVAFLRLQGLRLVIYLDDILLKSATAELIAQHQSLLVSLLEVLGFVINFPKSMVEPSHQVEFLGLIVDSQNMVLYVPQEKILKVAKECRQLRNRGVPETSPTWWDCCHL